jgi:DNA-directed RNA polymerase subunit N (RpoN/RPB10)
MGKFLARSRYEVTNDTEALDAIAKFIAENISTFTSALTDQRLLGQLQSLDNLTINEYSCLRYILASKGIDIWAMYVKENEINADDLSANTFEYNVLDKDTATSFIPMCTRFVQLTNENSLSKLYTEIVDAFGLFEGRLFVGMNNPIMVTVNAMKSDETVGVVSKFKTSYINSILDFLGKDLRVITD